MVLRGLRSGLGVVCVLLGLMGGCKLEVGKAGTACQRSAQCEPGLACVKGKCGKDLSSIAATNTSPMYGGRGAAGASAGSEAQAGSGQ